VTEANSGAPGLLQRVELSSAEPAVGDSIAVRSVVLNRTSAPITVGYGCMMHGLGLDGVEFKWESDITCMGFAMIALAPGDSLVRRIVTAPITSPPGEYSLGVHQLNSPSQGLYVRLRVRAK